MKRKYIFIVFIVILSVALFMVYQIFFIPTQIIEDVNTSHIVRIQYNVDNTGKFIDVDNYDETKILNYLNTCNERRTLHKAGKYFLSDVTIEIIIRTDIGPKDILLGNINYSSYGTGTTKYEILNSNEVTTALLEILNL